jgi:hypothetical protein
MSNRDIRKTLRFTKEEIEQIERERKKANLSFSEYARKVLLKKRVKCKSKDREKLIFELNRIGNNLNQITRRVNEKRMIDFKTLQEVEQIKKSLEEFLKNDS